MKKYTEEVTRSGQVVFLGNPPRRLCRLCGVTQEMDAFARPKGHYAYCRPCMAVYQKVAQERYAERRPDKFVNYNRNRLGTQRMQKYGLTDEDYEALVDGQNGVCRICERPQVESVLGGLDVDHNHGSGKVRGLLCRTCNSGIGFLLDDAAVIRRAAWYVASDGETTG